MNTYDLWFNYLLHLPYLEIIANCVINKYTANICQSDYFWQTKAQLDFNIDPSIFNSIVLTTPIVSHIKIPHINIYRVEPSVKLIDLSSINLTKGLVKYLYLLTKEKGCVKGSEFIEDINKCLENSAFNGNIELVQYFVSKGATDLNSALVAASANGHGNIVQLLLQNGADSYLNALTAALFNQQFDIIKLINQYRNL